MLETATQFSVKPRLVIVSSDVHYWSKIPKDVLQTPNIFRTLGSKEYSTKKYVLARQRQLFLLTASHTELWEIVILSLSVS